MGVIAAPPTPSTVWTGNGGAAYTPAVNWMARIVVAMTIRNRNSLNALILMIEHSLVRKKRGEGAEPDSSVADKAIARSRPLPAIP